MLKRSVVHPLVAMIVALQAFMFKAAIAVAQETKKVDVDIDVKGPNSGTVWYGNWWVWAIGIAVFLIIIVALTNRNRTDVVQR
jgi:tellurite resistance protein TehA-like permease